MLSWRAVRVGIISPENATRAPSEVYMDYHKFASQRALYRNKQEALANSQRSVDQVINKAGYPQGPAYGVGGFSVNSIDKATTRAAPFDVQVYDEDQGVLHFSPKPDVYRLYEMVSPSQVVFTDNEAAVGGPTSVMSDAPNLPVGFDMVASGNRIPKWAANFKACVIISMVPACPNDERQLFKVTIKPDDVSDSFPPSARSALKEAFGPVWQVRVGAAMEAARAFIPWDDGKGHEIEQIFGLLPGEPQPGIDTRVMNKSKTSTPAGLGVLEAPSLDAIAKAIATRIYARFADHIEGTAAGPLEPGAFLDGWTSEVDFQVGSQGETTSMVSFPGMLPMFPFEALLTGATRAILAREAQPL
jgi:hypothetical protein